MKNIISLIVVIVISLSGPSAIARSLNTLSYQSLKETILALDHTRIKSQTEIQRLRLSPSLENSHYKQTQLKEYLIFTEYLAYQINQYCEQIINLYGQDKTNGLPCETMSAAADLQSFEQQKELKTGTEQINELEDEFMASLGNFDEMLLKEEEEISQTSRKKSSSSSASGQSNSDSQGGKQSAGSGKESSGGENNSSNGNNSGSSGMGEQSESGKQSQQNGKQTTGKKYGGSGSGKGQAHKQSGYGNKTSERERRKLDEIDDDIVARQLKEAAEKENDPQLKEKLWEEYYRYKKGLNK